MAKKTKKVKDIQINFSGVDPVSGGRKFDRVPEGTYIVKVIKSELYQTSTDKPAITTTVRIEKGSMKGKKVGDMFLIPRKDTDDSNFALQRLSGLIVAGGKSKQKGKKSSKAVAAALLKLKPVVCEIADNIIEAVGEFKQRTVSSPVAYYAVGSKEGKEALAVEDEDEEDEDIDEEEEEEEEPKKKSKKAKKDDEDDDDDDEDLYDEDDEDEDDDDDDEDDDDDDDDDEDDDED